jgi:hypothetical protein
MVTFLSELNGMELWATNIGNAYLEAYTAEKLFIVAGPEFGDLEGRAHAHHFQSPAWAQNFWVMFA